MLKSIAVDKLVDFLQTENLSFRYTRIIFIITFLLVGTIAVSTTSVRQAFANHPAGEPGITDTEIVIGAFGALSGPVKAVGNPVKKGLQTYISYINDQGGIHGRTIRLIFEDDNFSPHIAQAIAKKFAEQDRVFAVCPALGTPGVLATIPYFAEQGIPLVYPMTGISETSNPFKKYVFSVQPNYYDEAKVLVRYARQQGAKKVAVLWQNNDIGRQGLAGVQDELKTAPDLQLVYEKSHTYLTVDFKTEISQLKQMGVDTIILYTLMNQTAAIMKEAKRQELKSLFMTTYVNADFNLINMAPDAVEGLLMTGWAGQATWDDPQFRKFVLEIYPKYNPGTAPTSYAVAGIVAGELLVEGLKRAGRDLTREKLIKALETLNGWQGIYTPGITYNSDSHSGVDSVYFLKIESGYLKVMENGKRYPLRIKTPPVKAQSKQS